MFGESKYGISRTFRVILDLRSGTFSCASAPARALLRRHRPRPGARSASPDPGTYLTGLKLFTGASIGTRPMFFGGFFFVIAGIQMVTTGVLAELLTRVYFESGQSQAYVARDSAPSTTPTAGSRQGRLSPHDCGTPSAGGPGLLGTPGRLIFALPLISFLLCLGAARCSTWTKAPSRGHPGDVRAGRLLFTYLNGAPRFDKPIFIYWLQSLGYLVFGVSEWAFRLPSALAAITWSYATWHFAGALRP